MFPGCSSGSPTCSKAARWLRAALCTMDSRWISAIMRVAPLKSRQAAMSTTRPSQPVMVSTKRN
jgi:hypothetical protein